MPSRLCYHLATDRLHTKQQIQAIEATLPAVNQINELSEFFRAHILKKCERMRKKGSGNRLLILVIDALTQLDSFEYDAGGHDAMPHDLEWLIPEKQMPSNLRIVLASLEGTPVEVLALPLPSPPPFSCFLLTDITCTHSPVVLLAHSPRFCLSTRSPRAIPFVHFCTHYNLRVHPISLLYTR